MNANHERRRVVTALARAQADLAELIGNLGSAERPLFAPEAELLLAVAPRIFAAIRDGLGAEDAVVAATSPAVHDLTIDARARLLDALDGESTLDQGGEDGTEPIVIVTRTLTPTLVARVSSRVVGLVVQAEEGQEEAMAASTSHAVLLARGRGVPLAFVGREVAESIADGAWVVIDASGDRACVWVGPDSDRLEEARAHQARDEETRSERSVRAKEPLRHLSFAVRANLSTVSELIPEGADGVGLLRTELFFAGRSRPPSLTEQINALVRVITDARGAPVIVRLFDGGADKPLAWLPQPEGATALRGIELLLAHPEILGTQLRAIAAVVERADVRVLVPMTLSPDDVGRVRSLTKPGTKVGAMIESTAAVRDALNIADASDFVSIGTNDLSASLSMRPRESGFGAPTSHIYRAIRSVVDAARIGRKAVTVCGELAADDGAALALAGLGVDAVSVAPSRFLGVKLSLLGATREECERSAREALG